MKVRSDKKYDISETDASKYMNVRYMQIEGRMRREWSDSSDRRELPLRIKRNGLPFPTQWKASASHVVDIKPLEILDASNEIGTRSTLRLSAMRVLL